MDNSKYRVVFPHVFNIFSRFALNRLYLEDRADLRHTVATRRIRLSYPEVLILWQITGIGNSCCNLYPLPHPHLPRGVGLAAGARKVLKKHVPGFLNMPKCWKVSKWMKTHKNDAKSIKNNLNQLISPPHPTPPPPHPPRDVFKKHYVWL